jgi:hypothetical protein
MNWSKVKDAPKIKKWSQCGEEGYIKYILDNIPHERFLVDIGASDGYSNSNTRYFIEQGYDAILLDGSNRGSKEVKQEWITAENICDVLKKYDCPKEFGLLSIDIDGNDSYIIEEILKEYRPSLIVAEINGTIPKGISKTIVYNPDHRFENDNYYGFSFDYAIKLAERNGYRVVFQNNAMNVYMVDKKFLDGQEIEIPFTPIQYHAHNDKGVWVNV